MVEVIFDPKFRDIFYKIKDKENQEIFIEITQKKIIRAGIQGF